MRLQLPHASPTGIVAVIIGCGLVLLLVHAFQSSHSERTDSALPIALVAPPAPPPTETKQPEPVPQHEPVPPIDSHEWTEGTTSTGSGPAAPGPASPGPTGPLGLNEAGGAGGDAFGLAGRLGGRELLAGGGGGGNPTARFLEFAGLLQSHVRDELRANTTLRRHCFAIDVDVWVGPAGALQRVKLRSSSGDRKVDSMIQAAFETLQSMSATPPPDMPWPVRLRITSDKPDCSD